MTTSETVGPAPATDTPRSRPAVPTGRDAAAGAAVLGVIARVASIIAWPADSDASHAKMLATAAAHPGRWAVATGAESLAWLAAGWAVLASVSLVRHHGVLLTRLGGWVYGSSLLALGFVGGAMNSVTGVLSRQPDRAAMLLVQDNLHGPTLSVFVTWILLGELLALAFAVGLARAKVTGWWFVGLSILALGGYIATASASNHLLVLAGFVPLGATWLVLARLLSRRL